MILYLDPSGEYPAGYLFPGSFHGILMPEEVLPGPGERENHWSTVVLMEDFMVN
jgi:hypothetical protein